MPAVASATRSRLDAAVRRAGLPVLWFTAADVGGALSTWRDRTRGVAASVVGSPTYGRTGINGRPAITNTAATGYTATPGLASGDWTLFAVFDITTLTSTTSSQYGMDAETGRLICAVESGNAGSTRTAYFDGSWRDSGTNQTTGRKVMTWRLSSGASVIRVNGVDHTTGGAYTAKAIGGTVGIFKGYSTTDGGVVGPIAEWILYPGALGDALIANLQRELGRYYRIPVA